MKRFTETTKWEDAWFADLQKEYKLVWLYLLDACNCAGIIDPNLRLIRFMTGCDVGHSDILSTFEGRIRELDSGKWYIPKFVAFQQGATALNPSNNAHRGIIRCLEKEGISPSLAPSQPQASPKLAPREPLARAPSKSKGIGKSKSKGKKGDARGMKRPTLEQWLTYAKEIEYPEADARSAFDHYESNGWKVGGRAPMKDWKASCRNCHKRNKQPNAKTISRNKGTYNDGTKQGEWAGLVRTGTGN